MLGVERPPFERVGRMSNHLGRNSFLFFLGSSRFEVGARLGLDRKSGPSRSGKLIET